MKLIVQIARVLTGLLFIFSGVIKLNDPTGFSIKLHEYFDVFAQDVSTRQDTLKITMKDGSKELASRAFVLYSFDTERELLIKSESDSIQEHETTFKIGRRKDTIWSDKVKVTYNVSVEAQLGGQSTVETEYDFPDSGTQAMFTLKATVGNKDVFQKDYKVSAGGVLDAKTTLNLRDHVKKESWLNGFFKKMNDFTLFLSVFICALEVILGFALIVGWRIKLIAWLLLLLIIFFTFLTFYAAYFNKVTDCGCFGDFIHLKPWQSFYKDLILLVLILIVFIGSKHIKPWFSKKFGWKFMAVITLLSSGFGVFCYIYLPVWDFLPYKEGNNIKEIMTFVPKGMRASDSISIIYVMQKGNDSVQIPFVAPYKEYSDKVKAGWKAGRRIDKVIIEGYHNPIHDFVITDAKTGMEYRDTFLNNEQYQILWDMPYLDKAYQGANKEAAEIAAWANTKKYRFWALTSSGPDLMENWVKTNKPGFNWYSSDQKTLLTIGRYAPTMYLFKGPVVIEKWSGRNLPSIKKLDKLTAK